jgi:hypothetical protein
MAPAGAVTNFKSEHPDRKNVAKKIQAAPIIGAIDVNVFAIRFVYTVKP